jgi:hypothetical protein
MWLMLMTGCGVSPEQHEADLMKLRSELQTTQREFSAFRAEVERDYIEVTRVRVPLEKTGNDVCSEIGKACMFLKSSRGYDAAGNFWGYSAFTCKSRVEKRANCLKTSEGVVQNYHITGGYFTKAPESIVSGTPAQGMCLSEPYYDYVYCVDTLDDRFTPGSQ